MSNAVNWFPPYPVPSNSHLLVTDLGRNALCVFAFDVKTGHTSEKPVQQFQIKGGPRTIALSKPVTAADSSHPGRFIYVYVSLELSNGLAVLVWDAKRAVLSGLLQLETLCRQTPSPLGEAKMEFPLAFIKTAPGHIGSEFDHKAHTMSHLALHPTGRWLYMAQRGLDVLFVFEVDQSCPPGGEGSADWGYVDQELIVPAGSTGGSEYPKTFPGQPEPLSPTKFQVPEGPSKGPGKVRFCGFVETRGKTPRNFAAAAGTPRHFAVRPDGAEVWVANQDSHSIVIFTVDGGSAEGTPGLKFSREIMVNSPAWVEFV